MERGINVDEFHELMEKVLEKYGKRIKMRDKNESKQTVMVPLDWLDDLILWMNDQVDMFVNRPDIW